MIGRGWVHRPGGLRLVGQLGAASSTGVVVSQSFLSPHSDNRRRLRSPALGEDMACRAVTSSDGRSRPLAQPRTVTVLLALSKASDIPSGLERHDGDPSLFRPQLID